MKSEMAQLNTQKKSLMHMMAKNDDFTYPFTPRGHTSIRSCTSHSDSATSKLIEEDRYNSAINHYNEVQTLNTFHSIV